VAVEKNEMSDKNLNFPSQMVRLKLCYPAPLTQYEFENKPNLYKAKIHQPLAML